MSTSVRNNIAIYYFNSIVLEEEGRSFLNIKYSHFTGREKLHIIKVIQLSPLWFPGKTTCLEKNPVEC